MTLQLHKPDGKGGLEKRAVADGDWRRHLRAARWGAGMRSRKVPRLANPEMNPTSTAMSVLFWLSLAALTFVVLVVGYGIGFWRLAPPA
jgi:hypothetical protein